MKNLQSFFSGSFYKPEYSKWELDKPVSRYMLLSDFWGKPWSSCSSRPSALRPVYVLCAQPASPAQQQLSWPNGSVALWPHLQTRVAAEPATEGHETRERLHAELWQCLDMSTAPNCCCDWAHRLVCNVQILFLNLESLVLLCASLLKSWGLYCVVGRNTDYWLENCCLLLGECFTFVNWGRWHLHSWSQKYVVLFINHSPHCVN